MGAMQAGINLPVMLPSLTDATKDMGPSCRYMYFGPDGFHSYYRGPGIETSQMTVAGGALGMGILMPALARTRQLAFRMTSGTNLSGIGKACVIYAEDHDGKLPPDLETLVKEADLRPQSLESKLKPKDFPGPSYIYIAGQTTSMDHRNIVAYEDPAYCIDGVNVVFLDGHVEFLKPEAFRQQLEATCKRLGRPVPEIRFKGEKEIKPAPPKPAGAPQA
jgi:prepilin-type processing-associated H-X9-DG protein